VHCHFHFMSEGFASLFLNPEIRAGPAIYCYKLVVFGDKVSDQIPVLLPRMPFVSPETRQYSACHLPRSKGRPKKVPSSLLLPGDIYVVLPAVFLVFFPPTGIMITSPVSVSQRVGRSAWFRQHNPRFSCSAHKTARCSINFPSTNLA
jgi:hypothetical protein